MLPTAERGLPAMPAHAGQAGFTLMLAALVASIVLSLGSSIFTIAQKQVNLSSLGRDSQFAFYAADTAAECALYWDIRFDAFGTSTPGSIPVCDTHTLEDADGLPLNDQFRPAEPPYTLSFQLDFFQDQIPRCGQVTVTKSTTNPHTVIHADGYSTSCSTIASSPRSLQRSVELRY